MMCNRWFTFLNIVLIYWTCLAGIMKLPWGCLSAPAFLGDFASHLWKQLDPCNIPKKRDLRVFIGSFCVLQYCDKLQVLGMGKGLATVAKDLGKMG